MKYLIALISAILLIDLRPTTGHIDDIIHKCPDGSCVLHLEDDRGFNQTAYQESVYKFVTSGFGQFIWDSVRKSAADPSLKLPVSLECKNSLSNVISGLDKGDVHSLQMVSSTGKTPDNLFQRTLTSLGDYDGCLSIGAKYCLADIFPTRFESSFKQSHPDLLRLEELTAFRNFSFISGICLPSTCSESDVKSILETSLTPHFFRPNGFMDCDTKESTSWLTRLRGMTIHQFVSLLFISSLLSVIFMSTLWHLILVGPELIKVSCFQDVLDNLDKTESNTWVDSFSLIKNAIRLLFVRVAEEGAPDRFLMIDAYKLFVVLFGCLGHAFVCLEIPNSYFMLENHQFLQDIFSSASKQQLFNDNGLVVFAHLGGFATFHALFPIMNKLIKEKKKFPYTLAILDRYLRFIPSIMTIVAMEFIWTLSFDGPFFTRVSNFVLDKCTRSWWWQFTFMQNMFPGLDICAGHTFFSGVDMQLFLIGLIVMTVMTRSQMKGILLCGIITLLSISRVAYVAFKTEIYGTLYRPWPDTTKILEYVDMIHMPVAVYVPGYIVGLLNGLALHKGFRFNFNSRYSFWINAALIAAATNISAATGIANGLYNVYGLIPQFLVPFLIIFNRTVQVITPAVMLTYYMTFYHPVKNHSDELQNQETSKTASTQETTESNSVEATTEKKSQKVFSPVTAFCRLSYAVYISNYFVVKTEFFTSRTLLRLGWHGTVQRLIMSITAMIVMAVIFHLAVVSPFDNLRRKLMSSKQPKSKTV